MLAVEPLAETLARDGVTVWAANPIDAFPRSVQGEYLDFLHDGRVPPSADVAVVVTPRARVAALGPGWVERRAVGDLVVLERSGG